MKVILEDKTYWIDFVYGKAATDWAQCRIRDASGWAPGKSHQPDELPVVAVGVVNRHVKDSPNREVARKQSLRKALDAMFPPLIPGHRHRTSTEETRQRRKLFWDAYNNRKLQQRRKVA